MNRRSAASHSIKDNCTPFPAERGWNGNTAQQRQSRNSFPAIYGDVDRLFTGREADDNRYIPRFGCHVSPAVVEAPAIMSAQIIDGKVVAKSI